MSDWRRFDYQFRESEWEKNERLRKLVRANPCKHLGHRYDEDGKCERCAAVRGGDE